MIKNNARPTIFERKKSVPSYKKKSVHSYLECSKPNQSDRKTVNRTNPNRNRKKPHLVRMYSNHFFYSTAWFGSVCGFDFINRTKPQDKKNTN